MEQATGDTTIRQVAATRLPTAWGTFQTFGFERQSPRGKLETAVALVMGDITQGAPLARIHSQCLTGDVLGSLRCDCGQQLERAMQAIAEEKCGVLIYEHQEGRGIGLMAKLQAYALQDAGLDTVEANQHLGLAVDLRDFVLPATILRQLGVKQVRLMTNNPLKVEAVENAGIAIAERVPCEVSPSKYDEFYLATKKHKMGHLLTVV